MADAASRRAGSPVVRARGLRKAYGGVEALAAIDLDIAQGEFLAILGPSGCGKSTLLRILAGFVTPTAGRVEIDGRDVTGLGPERRPTNMVFQSYGLFPHMDVRANVAFGLRVARRPDAEVAERVSRVLALVQLEALAERPIDRLSGGQQQRVALARALVMEPRVLLLDEPLAALDLKLRQAMQEELRRIHALTGGTFVVVTHDQGEAFHLADRVVVMDKGRIEQQGTPEEVYAAPASAFVADFIGETNRLEGLRRDGILSLRDGTTLASPGPDGPALLLVRPEAFAFAPSGIPATVEDAIFLGTTVRYLVRTTAGDLVRLYEPATSPRRAPGAAVHLGFDAQRVREVREP